MDIKSEVIRIVNKAMGKKSFLDVYFFDTKVISSLKQIDYIQKTYEFKSSPLEFLEISSFSKLYETQKNIRPVLMNLMIHSETHFLINSFLTFYETSTLKRTKPL